MAPVRRRPSHCPELFPAVPDSPRVPEGEPGPDGRRSGFPCRNPQSFGVHHPPAAMVFAQEPGQCTTRSTSEKASPDTACCSRDHLPDRHRHEPLLPTRRSIVCPLQSARLMPTSSRRSMPGFGKGTQRLPGVSRSVAEVRPVLGRCDRVASLRQPGSILMNWGSGPSCAARVSGLHLTAPGACGILRVQAGVPS